MSKILYVLNRSNQINTQNVEKIRTICQNLNPDNITPNPSIVSKNNKIVFGISNPVSTIKINDNDILLGQIFGNSQDWRVIGKNYPDGNYAIFRANESEVEVVSDILGSRAIWYYKNEDVFIASTSQIAIIKYLGNFKFEQNIIPWMISTGSLGPKYSWDKRIKRVPTDGSVTINRNEWTLSLRSNDVEFIPSNLNEKQQELHLKGAIENTFMNINLDFEKWAITLSGGHDSRAILLLFNKMLKKSGKELHTITWGTNGSISDPIGDTYIAKTLAEKIGTKHNFFSTELSNENLDTVVSRFINNGEGRIDHIGAYLDGFKIWKNIFNEGFEGVTRGDEVFGYNKIFSPLIINSFMGLTLCSDYSNLKKYDFIQNLNQKVPDNLKQKKHESIPTWRDRIFQQYRIPFMQSALADLKYSYVEQINPFLSRQIVSIIRQLPDYLRTDKKLFKRVMKKMDCGIPFSQRDSNINVKDFLKNPQMVDLLTKELTSEYAKNIFPESFLNEVLGNLLNNREHPKSRNMNLINLIKKAIPLKYKKYLKQKNNTLTMDENTLGFRLLIICRMHKILSTKID